MFLKPLSQTASQFLRRNKDEVLVFGLFILVAIMFWYPLPFYLRTGELGGLPTDPMYNQYILGWGVHALTHYPWHFFEANMFYPFHHTLAWGDTLFSLTIFAVFLKPVFGLIGAYNVLLIASTVLSGYFTFLLIKEVTNSRRAGVVGGLIWCLSHFRVIEQAHIQMLSTQWIPLTLYFAERIRKEKGTRTTFWFTVAAWLMLTTNIYLAIFTVLSFALYVVAMIAMRAVKLKALLRWALGWLVAGALAVPIYLPSIINNLHHPIDRGYNVDSANLSGFLPWPWPGKIIRHLLRLVHLPADGESYHTIGLLTIPLLVTAIILLIQHRKKIPQHAFVIFCIALAICAGLAATGPFTHWQDKLIINGNPFFTVPYHFIPGYKVLRTILRWHFLSMLGIAVVAAFGAVPLVRKMPRKWFMVLVCIFALWLIVEQANSPWHITPVYRIQDYPVYSWLQKQPGEFPILELPIYPGMNNFNNDLIEAKRMYFSTYHWKKRVSGGISPSISEEYLYNAGLLNEMSATNQQGIGLLEKWNVKYIIFLPDDYATLGWSNAERDTTKQWLDSDNSLKKVAQFDSATVYQLNSYKE